MGERFTRAQRNVIVPALMENQGGLCAMCHVHAKDTPDGYLCIDHVDNDHTNNNFNNLQLLCRSDNTSKDMSRRKAKIADQILNGHKNGHAPAPVSQLTSEREREKLLDRGLEVRGVLDYQRGSLEMQANDWYEPVVIQYLASRVEQDGLADYVDTVNAAAELAGCNPTTVKRYLDKKTSSVGRYEIVKDPSTKRRVIQLRGPQ
tara:strand:+ start:1676 stop:2287 length:612 start_codon:yes stop_codon:yes gene_type:complete